MDNRPLRIGVLGAARIVPTALIEPALQLGRARVVAVAARDAARAVSYAEQHGIDHAAVSYAALLERNDVDAVYNPLPASHHRRWTLAALAAGKHVLCEKPFAANAYDAELMVSAARERGLILMEGFHYRYHPLMGRVCRILQSGELGPVQRIEAVLCSGIADTDIRYAPDLGGGVMMDLGCYALHWARTAAASEPEVVRARAELGPPGIDVSMQAELRFPNGVEGSIRCSMKITAHFEASLTVTCRDGELFVFNPLAPHHAHMLRVRRSDGSELVETVPGHSTYYHQLEAFVGAIESGTPPITSGADSLANMQAIDAVYRAAGMAPRLSVQVD